MMETGFAEKPDVQELHALEVNYNMKQDVLKKRLKEQFQEMHNTLIVQEHMAETVLMKNLQYMDN